jgi:hypothetical protein
MIIIVETKPDRVSGRPRNVRRSHARGGNWFQKGKHTRKFRAKKSPHMAFDHVGLGIAYFNDAIALVRISSH